MRRPITLLATLLAAGALLAGCSARKLAYGYLDTFLYRSLDSTFDVEGGQKDFLKSKLDALHAWHAREELPRYVEDLSGLEARAADGLSREEVVWFYGRLETARARIVDRVMPDAVAFLRTVRAEQVVNVEKQNDKWHGKRQERLSRPPADYAEEKAERLGKMFEPWLGDLTVEQEARLEAFSRTTQALDKEGADLARESQKRFVAMLRAGPDEAAIERTLREGMRPLDPEVNPNQARLRDLVVEIAALATPKQKEHFVREVRAWRADFQELHVKHGRKAPAAPETGSLK